MIGGKDGNGTAEENQPKSLHHRLRHSTKTPIQKTSILQAIIENKAQNGFTRKNKHDERLSHPGPGASHADIRLGEEVWKS